MVRGIESVRIVSSPFPATRCPKHAAKFSGEWGEENGERGGAGSGFFGDREGMDETVKAD